MSVIDEPCHTVISSRTSPYIEHLLGIYHHSTNTDVFTILSGVKKPNKNWLAPLLLAGYLSILPVLQLPCTASSDRYDKPTLLIMKLELWNFDLLEFKSWFLSQANQDTSAMDAVF